MADSTQEPEESENKFIDAAMGIIMSAGDARNHAKESIDALLAGDEEKADELLEQAKKDILAGHRAQTSIIQEEARYEMTTKKSQQIPLLFIHAQDTIMTIMSEVNLTESMEKMYKAIKHPED
jgi:PTS system cellobiose-specific IIA component